MSPMGRHARLIGLVMLWFFSGSAFGFLAVLAFVEYSATDLMPSHVQFDKTTLLAGGLASLSGIWPVLGWLMIVRVFPWVERGWGGFLFGTVALAPALVAVNSLVVRIAFVDYCATSGGHGLGRGIAVAAFVLPGLFAYLPGMLLPRMLIPSLMPGAFLGAQRQTVDME